MGVWGQRRGGGRAFLIDGRFVRGCVHDNEVSFQRPRHVEAFIKQDFYGKVGNLLLILFTTRTVQIQHTFISKQ